MGQLRNYTYPIVTRFFFLTNKGISMQELGIYLIR